MNNKKAQVGVFFLLAGLSLVGLIVLNGCKKKSEPSAPSETQQPASTTIEQTTCPVMGGAESLRRIQGKKGLFLLRRVQNRIWKEPGKIHQQTSAVFKIERVWYEKEKHNCNNPCCRNISCCGYLFK